jgi:ribose/xylose/arabinose/galactoside ABC-type transport system permease subunit
VSRIDGSESLGTTTPGQEDAGTGAPQLKSGSSPQAQPANNLLRAINQVRQRGIMSWVPPWIVPFLALIIVTLYFGITGGTRFLSLSNGNFLLQQSAVIAVPAFGTTLVIIAGSIDLSVGSIVGLTGAVAAIIGQDTNILLGMFVAVLVGAAAGFVNGFVFAVMKAPSFMVTLGMLSVASGVTVVVTNSQPINVDSSFQVIGEMPGIVVLLAVCFLISVVLLHYTTFGRRVVAVGGQERVARLSGIDVTRVKILVFVFAGFMAALGGLVLTAHVGSATPDAATGFELTAITAVVLGGTPLTGGIGNMVNTLVGSLILSILLNGMIILGISSQVQLIVQGMVLVAAVLLAFDRSKIGIVK